MACNRLGVCADFGLYIGLLGGKVLQKINIVAVGNLKEKYWVDAVNEYKKRLGRFAEVEIKEVPEFSGNSKTSIDKIKESECDELAKKISGFVIAMDKDGEQPTSESLARFLDETFSKGVKNITFVIGGSNGLTKEIIQKANKTFSFGKITFPHQLMRVVLLEQIYRAETILNNIAYHK